MKKQRDTEIKEKQGWEREKQKERGHTLKRIWELDW